MMNRLLAGAPVVAGGIFLTAVAWPGEGRPMTPAPPAGPPAAFAKCAMCHTVNRGGKAGIGPNLFGVFGSKAGGRAGFAYSPALKRSAVVWSRPTLLRFLKDPSSVAPGTAMPPPDLQPAERDAVINYLTSLK